MSKGRWIIVSNRLPFKKDPDTGEISKSSGGLVSAISGIRSDSSAPSRIWVGTAQKDLTEKELKKAESSETELVPIHLSESLYHQYYNGFSNDVLWPLLHYETDYVQFHWSRWKAYRKVNQLFAKTILEKAKQDDLIWIHDFHLFLLPKMLKDANPKLRVGFFLHVPFPSSEIFRQLPVRREILEGVLRADLIGFHDYSYLRHFGIAVQAILGIDSSLLMVKTPDDEVQLGVFPVSIDTKKFQNRANSKQVAKIVADYKRQLTSEFTVLGVDRLDYTKGIDLKLQAFREMLLSEPSLVGKVSLVQVAVPSRTEVPEYARLKEEIERQVGQINGEFGHPGYVPVQYIFNSLSFSELVALYRVANILLVASKRDGMNLVSLEYLAAQDPANPGVAMLSEFAGAISTLSHVMPINPWDTLGTAKRLSHSLRLEQSERVNKHKQMISYLEGYTATDWAKSFMGALEKKKRPHSKSEEIQVSKGKVSLPSGIKQKMKKKKLLIFTDYDGTLVPLEDSPEEAVLNREGKNVVRGLLKNDRVELIVVSGRNNRFLADQFSGLSLSMAAEHGAKFFRPDRKRWFSLVHSDTQSWYPVARKIMRDYSSHVPESFIEEKDHSLTWHYRKSPPGFAGYQSRKLSQELEMGLSNHPVTVLSGKKVVEARAIEANKGAFVRWYLANHPELSEYVMVAVGDDRTDEDLFASLPEESITIKVGEGATKARYRVENQDEVVRLLSYFGELVG